MGSSDGSTFSLIYIADFGILACCLLSIACRVKLFAATRRNSCEAPVSPLVDANCAFTPSSFLSGRPTDVLNVTRTATATTTAEVRRGGAVELCGNTHAVGFLDTPALVPHTHTAPAQGVAAVSAFSGSVMEDSRVSDDVGDKGETKEDELDDDWDGEETKGFFMRWLLLPLSLRIMVCVGWLSVVSNCLTSYLRPSQVLYALLSSCCDTALYVGCGTSSCKRKHNRSSFSSSLLGGTTSVHVGTHAASSLWPRERTFLSTLWAIRLVPARGGVDQKGELPPPARSVSAACYDGGATSGRDFKVRVVGWRHKCGEAFGGLFLVLRSQLYIVSLRQFFLIVFGLFFLIILVTFHLRYSFFWVGTWAGYLASCGTLYVLGCDIGALWILFDWKRGKRSFPLQTSSPSPLLADADLTRCFADIELPPLRALLSRSLGVCYVMQFVFSFGCSLFYFSMLLEEGRALYESHVEFMRWYVATAGQALLEILRLLAFWHLAQLCSGPDGKNWRQLLHTLEELR